MRKFLALIMVIAMVASFAVLAFAEDTTKTVTFKFDDGKADDGLTAVGENFTYADGKVTLGANSYFEVTGLDLKGATAITVVAKVTKTGGNAWVFEATSQERHTWNDGATEQYVGLLLNGKAVGEVFNGTRPNPESAAADMADNEEITITAVYEPNKTTITVNDGTPVSIDRTDDYSVAAALGDDPKAYIGHANWNDGEYADGLVIDEITITATYASASTEGGEGGSGEKQPAPPTGFATVALAVAALGSGAYIVSKKQH